MNRKILLPLCLAVAVTAQAQSDISTFFLTNNGFDTQFNYDATQKGNIKGDVINEVYGWTNETTATYTVAGTFAYNPNVTFNGSYALPSSGYNGSEGGALGLTTGWGMQLVYTQTVTLPIGTYKLCSAYYNVGTATAGKSLLAWIPNSGTTTASTVSSFPVKSWKPDTLTFTLRKATTGTIRIGLSTNEGSGSGNHAKVLVDYVKLLCDSIDKGSLKKALRMGNSTYGDGTGDGAAELKQAINEAQTTYDDAEATPIEILTATQQLNDAIQAYNYKNASKTNPLSVTTSITNPNFENGTTGWNNDGLNAQTNSYFTGKSGSTYLERWVSIGSKVPDVSIEQTLTGLHNGKYRLTAAVANIQQKSTNSTVNAGEKQTGATLYAGFYETAVDTMKSGKSLYFTVVDGQAKIGFKTVNATGNWVCLDNFRLYFVGENSAADYAAYLNAYAAYVNDSQMNKRMQATVRQNAEAAIAQAQKAANASPLDETAMAEAKAALDSIVVSIGQSAAFYDELSETIDYANKVREWYKDDETKAATMDAAIETAQSALDNAELTEEQITAANTALTKATKSVDKKIYAPQWSLGDVNDANNTYYMGRTRQSKNWILFWEKGYSGNPNSFTCGNYTIDVDEVLEHAEIAFNFYADSLKFITPGQSKTDTYKMVIRLRYEPTAWEASGSGVDNLIGLLTLTPWATPSRDWQTLYHEIGHCFQYQTHCDNGDQNGWMYAPGGGNGCAFWEQCAQWQAYKIMPAAQFTNEWFSGYLSNVHRHILHESPRYNNYFVQDYWTYRHGIDFMGRLWNESKNPEDAVEAYIRINGITTADFNDEMYDCAARFATWDIPALRNYGASKIDSRPQPGMDDAGDDYWRINASVVPQNTGHNIIKLNAPTSATTVTACFEGLNNQSGYHVVKAAQAEWRYGFVAQLADGSRVYGDMGKSTYSDTKDTVRFNCPDNCKRLYFVVSGGPKNYWRQIWDDNDDNDEQWPYQVKFGNTNLYGKTNVPDATAISAIAADGDVPAVFVTNHTLHIGQPASPMSVRIATLSGACVMNSSAGLSAINVELPSGVYIVKLSSTNGRTLATKKIVVR